MSQSHDLHRALLRPAIIHILRAQGFHSTKPSVLDTLVNLAERHILALASATAQHAYASHNDPVPTISDLRMALSASGVLIPLTSPSEEAWKEYMRRPLPELAQAVKGAEERVQAAKRKRDDEDTRDVREFTSWYDSASYKEIKRVAGLIPDPNTSGIAVGVGGGLMHGDDFLTTLKKKQNKAGADHDARLQGTVLGRNGDDREIFVEGGPVQRIRDWRPPPPPRTEDRNGSPEQAEKRDVSPADMAMHEIAAAS
ncbi:related to Bromodomain associated domain [Lecanosticta acicola]|uniref:Related to Bromodomain associated domain n=1 Tax=Lecanosticta acicola TaxID=111012 RepID=A0AAI8Z912_9PEZI|nr:related to Bromodomain associated domain [Lecanosticta acicola]